MRIKRFQGGYDKNFCYVLSCDETRMAAIIDPAVEINPIIEYIESEDLILDKILKIKYGSLARISQPSC